MFEKTRDKMVLSAATAALGLALGAGPARAQEVIIADPDAPAVVVEVAPDPGDTVVPDYCHAKIPGLPDKPTGSDEPQITPDWQDWIDYYGPCNQADMYDTQMQLKPTNPDD